MRLWTDWPVFLAVWSAAAMYLAALGGAQLRKRFQHGQETPGDLAVLLSASLTLLGLIIGFSFSMAVARYDQRKQDEAEEANAIGTEYLRVEMMPTASAAQAQALLRRYLSARIGFYELSDPDNLARNDRKTSDIQTRMWAVVNDNTRARPTPISALIAQGMNDVINTQGYTQAAWLNRIPTSAWVLLVVIGVACSALFGFQVTPHGAVYRRLVMLPIIVAVAFMLIADLDSPRHGFIRNVPENLRLLASSIGLTP